MGSGFWTHTKGVEANGASATDRTTGRVDSSCSHDDLLHVGDDLDEGRRAERGERAERSRHPRPDRVGVRQVAETAPHVPEQGVEHRDCQRGSP